MCTYRSGTKCFWYSLLDIENQELTHGAWEDEVIWDSEAMPRIPTPKVLTLDPNDENLIWEIPEDNPPDLQPTNEKKLQARSKPKNESSPTKPMDPFNISNDW